MKRSMWALFLLFVAWGCATVEPISTKSGMPAVTICKLSKTEIMERFAAVLSMDGWNIESANNYQIVVSKPSESRMVFSFADLSGNCTYIGARLHIVTNPGSGFERKTDFSRSKDAHELQQQLENLKSLAEESRTGKAAITKPRLSPPQPQPQTPPQVRDTPKKLVSASEYNSRGFEYYKSGQYNKAIEDFTTALSMESNPSFSIYINRGASFFELKQYEKALADFKQAITMAPDNARGYAWCGDVYYAVQSYREALEYFSKAVAMDPNKAVYHLNKGYANAEVGNRLMAMSDFKRACELGNREGCNQAERDRTLGDIPSRGNSVIMQGQKQLNFGSGPSYYDAHPEQRIMDEITQANKPLEDMQLKLIEDMRTRQQGYGLGFHRDYPSPPPPPPPSPGPPPPSGMIDCPGGAIDNAGIFYPGAGGGVIGPRGYMPDVGGGYIDPATGRFIPKW